MFSISKIQLKNRHQHRLWRKARISKNISRRILTANKVIETKIEMKMVESLNKSMIFPCIVVSIHACLKVYFIFTSGVHAPIILLSRLRFTSCGVFSCFNQHKKYNIYIYICISKWLLRKLTKKFNISNISH